MESAGCQYLGKFVIFFMCFVSLTFRLVFILMVLDFSWLIL